MAYDLYNLFLKNVLTTNDFICIFRAFLVLSWGYLKKDLSSQLFRPSLQLLHRIPRHLLLPCLIPAAVQARRPPWTRRPAVCKSNCPNYLLLFSSLPHVDSRFCNQHVVIIKFFLLRLRCCRAGWPALFFRVWLWLGVNCCADCRILEWNVFDYPCIPGKNKKTCASLFNFPLLARIVVLPLSLFILLIFIMMGLLENFPSERSSCPNLRVILLPSSIPFGYLGYSAVSIFLLEICSISEFTRVSWTVLLLWVLIQLPVMGFTFSRLFCALHKAPCVFSIRAKAIKYISFSYFSSSLNS